MSAMKNAGRGTRSMIRRAGTVAAALAVAAATTSCTGADGPAEGYQRVETGWMQVDVPADWVDAGGVDETWTASYQDVEGEDPSYQLLLAPEFAHDTALGATSQIIGSAQLGAYPDFSVVEQGDPSREEDFAHYNRVRFTYTGNDGTTYEAVLWGVADDDENAVLAQLTGESLDDELVQTIGDSIVVTGEG